MVSTHAGPNRFGPTLQYARTEPLAALTSWQTYRPGWPGRILAATGGSMTADPALRAARALADRYEAAVDLVVIHAPRVALPPTPERQGFDRCEAAERHEAALRLVAVRQQCRTVLGATRDWPMRMGVGIPAAVMSRLALELNSDLVVLGIGPADRAERRRGSHTAVYLSRQVHVPMLATANGCEEPKRCVVVLPNGYPHAPTLAGAVACTAPGGRMWVLVPSSRTTGAGAGAALELVARACGTDWAERAERLQANVVETDGDPLSAALLLAEDLDAQLIATPIRGTPGPVRAFLPNIAEPLLLSAHCSVLVAPDEP